MRQHSIFALLPLALATLSLSSQSFASPIEEVTVYSDLNTSKLVELSNSATVFGESEIKSKHATHLSELLNFAPNINFSSGASRGRFFQIRGIGERSQFVDPVNPSVGLVIDGIDFTGLGLAANTLDIEQIEILRGPQGTNYGANALAGLINLKSNAPTNSFFASLSTNYSKYDTFSIDGVLNGQLTNNSAYRIAARVNKSDGYIKNDFLMQDDTNNIDEEIIKTAFAVDLNETLSLDLHLYYINVENGYDAFSLLNNRTTTSDQPGRDEQETFAGSATFNWDTNTRYDVQLQVSAANSDTHYGYDEDWSFDGEFVNSTYPFSSADDYQRDKNNVSLDLRFISNTQSDYKANTSHAVFGLYTRVEDEKLQRTKLKDLAFNGLFENQFKTQNYAAYTHITTQLSKHLTLVTGARVELRLADYSDSEKVDKEANETHIGGKIALEYRNEQGSLWYTLVSRGYKSGGVNGQIISAAKNNSLITDDVFFFNDEALTNYEIGYKGRWLDNLNAQIALFYQQRKNAQFKQSTFNPADKSFDDYLANGNGNSVGAEIELQYVASENLNLYASLGLLKSEFDDYQTHAHVDARDDNTGASLGEINLDGRDVAHAPNYQYALGGEYRLFNDWYFSAEVEAKDAFYFSNSHSEKSHSYQAFNASLAYRANNWELSVWGKNLSDEDIEVRGFYFSNQFGNNPGNGYAPETYTQLDAPRTVGVSARISFD